VTRDVSDGAGRAVSAPPQSSGYVDVGALDVYYERHGRGAPLVLLHGAMATIESCFAGLAALRVPTLLIVGDADVVRPEHTVEMFRLLGGGVPGDLGELPRAQLAVLPGTSHVGLLDRIDWLCSMILAFLTPPPQHQCTGPLERQGCSRAMGVRTAIW
jgi:pimeloyl-ACP methyl ester carboxylesterase